jgi:chromosome segregation ATPase
MMASGEIVTGIDALLKYINEHGETGGASLAMALGISEKTVEDWANILEKANMIKITYKVGKMYVSPRQMSKEDMNAEKSKIEVQRTTLENDAKRQLSAMQQLEGKLQEFNKSINNIEQVFNRSTGKEVKNGLERIKRVDEEVKSKFNSIRQSKEAIEKMEEELNGKLETLDNRINATPVGIEQQYNEAKKIIQEMTGAITDSEKQVKDILNRFEAESREQKDRIYEVAKMIKSQRKELQELVSEQGRYFSGYQKDYQEYTKRAGEIKNAIVKEKQALSHDISDNKNSITAMYNAAAEEFNKINETIGQERTKFGELGKFMEQINDLKKEIDEIAKEKEAVEKALNEIIVEAGAISSIAGGDLGKKQDAISSVKKKSSDTSQKIKDIFSKTDRVKEGVDNISK